MAELGRAALARHARAVALRARRRGCGCRARAAAARAVSARNALIASFASTLVAALVLVAGFLRDDFSLAYVAGHSSRALPPPYKISAFWGGQEGSLLLWLLILTGYAALAVWLNAEAGARPRRLGHARARRDRRRLHLASRRRLEPVRRDRRAGRRARPQPEPPEPVHGRPPGVPLPRLRRARGAVRVRDGRAPLRPHRRALDRRDAALDARRVDGARDRAAARRALGLPGGRLGRLLRLGSRRERRADALARGDRVPALGDDPGEARDAEGLERRRSSALAFCLSLFGTFLTRSGVVNSIHSFTQSSIGPWFLALHRRRGRLLGHDDLAAAAAAAHDARGSSRSSRARRCSSTTTCCSSRSASRSSGARRGRSSPRRCAGESVVVGRPYYDFFLRIFGLPLLLLMGIGPLVAWRRASLRGLARDLCLARGDRARHRRRS